MAGSERRLAAIMFTDMVGYTAMVQANESRALGVLKRHQNLVRPIVSRHGGREVKTMGDAFLVEFPSALSATRCAVELERALTRFNEGKRKKVAVRVGIHVGDVVHERGDIFGDAVNIASRIVSEAESGGVCVSQQAYDQVRNKLPYRFSNLGARQLKNVSLPVQVFRLELARRRGDESGGFDETRRLAVLPFANMSQDSGDDYFADGLTEEMISTLSKLPEIEVISRTSVMQYKRAPKPMRDVFRELNSGIVLEGSVRKADTRVRITVQMVDAQRDRHLWAETYDRDLKDIFDIQREVAMLVAEAMKVKVLPSATDRIGRRPTASPAAYTLYLRGRYLWNMRGVGDVRKAAGYFERAVGRDPKFALGYVGMADCYQVMATKFEVDVSENWRKAKRALAKALRLDPGLAEAHASRAVALLGGYDLRGAEAGFRRAIELKPSYASAHQWYSQLLIAQLRWDDALSHIEKAAELDPFSQIICMVHTLLYEARRDYGSALRLAERGAELNPNDGGCRIELAWLHGKMREFDRMEEEMGEGLALVKKAAPFADRGIEAMMAYLRDDRDRVRRALPGLEAHLGETFTAVRFVADLHFYLGEADEGFEWLERSFSEGEFDLLYLKSDEFLDGLRTDGRYLRLLGKLGLG